MPRWVRDWIGVSALSVAGVASAQPSPPADGLRWSLGLGVISSARPYVGADDEIQAIPLVELKYKRFYVEGIRAGYHLLDTSDLQLDLRAQARFAGFDEGDSPFLSGMDERKESIDAGVVLDWTLGAFELGFGILGDVLDHSDGVEARTTLTWPKFLADRRLALFPAAAVVWESDKLVDYYAGVRPEEALPDRPEYEGGESVNVELGLTAFYRFTAHWRGVAVLRGQRLGSEYEDSPIIDTAWGLFGLVGVGYEF